MGKTNKVTIGPGPGGAAFIHKVYSANTIQYILGFHHFSLGCILINVDRDGDKTLTAQGKE